MAPSDVLAGAHCQATFPLQAGEQGRAALSKMLEDFETVLQHVTHDDTGAFIFFAGSLRDDPAKADAISSVIER